MLLILFLCDRGGCKLQELGQRIHSVTEWTLMPPVKFTAFQGVFLPKSN